LIVGTSTGALVGAALSLGIKPKTIEQFYLKRGPLIFGKTTKFNVTKTFRRVFVSAPYDPQQLHDAIRALVGDKAAETPLKKLNIPFVCTAVSHTRGQVRLFGAGKFAQSAEEISLEDAIVASAAAPTYFPSKQYQEENLIDGGLVANAPELVALAIARSTLGISLEDIRLLAIGTAGISGGLSAANVDRRGIIRWLLSKRGLVQLAMSAQEHLARHVTRQLLRDNYMIIDQAPTANQASVLYDLDNTSEATTKTLLALAEAAWTEFTKDDRHRIFFTR
jgi:predicted acylesterase/phospholipase RssA